MTPARIPETGDRAGKDALTGILTAIVRCLLISSGTSGRKNGRGRPAFFRRLFFSVALLALAGQLAGAEVPAVPPDEAEALIPEVPDVWSRTLNVRASAGYNDNLLQDAARSEQSLALGAGMEASWFRLPLDGRQLVLDFVGDYIYYPNGHQVDHEASLLGLAQVKLDLSPRWQTALDLNYVYIDQVVDTSITETNLSSSPVRGHGIGVRPAILAELSRGFRIVLDVLASRQFLDQPFDDYWEGGPRMTLEHDYSNRSGLAFSYAWRQRTYDTRKEVALAGTNVPGTELEFQMQEVELAWRHNWDEQRRWRTLTRLGFLANRDSGSGYFDYQRYQIAQQLRYVARVWEAKAQFRLFYYEFPHQDADHLGTDRAKTAVAASLRAERELAKHLRLFAEYSFEESFSNRATDQYRLNRVAAGVDCGF